MQSFSKFNGIAVYYIEKIFFYVLYRKYICCIKYITYLNILNISYNYIICGLYSSYVWNALLCFSCPVRGQFCDCSTGPGKEGTYSAWWCLAAQLAKLYFPGTNLSFWFAFGEAETCLVTSIRAGGADLLSPVSPCIPVPGDSLKPRSSRAGSKHEGPLSTRREPRATCCNALTSQAPAKALSVLGMHAALHLLIDLVIRLPGPARIMKGKFTGEGARCLSSLSRAQSTTAQPPVYESAPCTPLALLCSAPAPSMPWGGVGAVPGPSSIKSFWLGLAQETRCPGGRESEGAHTSLLPSSVSRSQWRDSLPCSSGLGVVFAPYNSIVSGGFPTPGPDVRKQPLYYTCLSNDPIWMFSLFPGP